MLSREPLYDRLLDILRRHVRQADIHLTDVEFVNAVHRRFVASREDYIIDPNE
jgi:hypothetical protein